MFSTRQIITGNQLVRNLKKITTYLQCYPQPLLIMQKGKEHLVLVNAEIFEELMSLKFERSGLSMPPSGVSDILNPSI